MGVSIVIPTYNRPLLLDNLLSSISKQTYKDFEVIVIDDNSKDQKKIEEVIKKYQPIFCLTFLKNELSRGAPYSRNRGILLARYEFIALVDDDDEWFPEKLKRQVELFSSSPENVGLIYTWVKVVNSQREVLCEDRGEIEGNAKGEILTSCFVPSPSVMLRKKVFDKDKAGLFDESLPSCQDWDMWTRVLFADYSCRVCREFLAYYFKHEGPTIGTSPRAKEGFKLYYEKHFFKLLVYGKIRHLVRFLRLFFKI